MGGPFFSGRGSGDGHELVPGLVIQRERAREALS